MSAYLNDSSLFHQGESNNTQTTWPDKVKTLVTDLRTDLGLGDVPFLAGELAYDGNCSGHNVQVRKLPSVISNAHVVSAEGLSVDPADTEWNVHFGHDSTVTFGKRYAATMIEALGWGQSGSAGTAGMPGAGTSGAGTSGTGP